MASADDNVTPPSKISPAGPFPPCSVSIPAFSRTKTVPGPPAVPGLKTNDAPLTDVPSRRIWSRRIKRPEPDKPLVRTVIFLTNEVVPPTASSNTSPPVWPAAKELESITKSKPPSNDPTAPVRVMPPPPEASIASWESRIVLVKSTKEPVKLIPAPPLVPMKPEFATINPSKEAIEPELMVKDSSQSPWVPSNLPKTTSPPRIRASVLIVSSAPGEFDEMVALALLLVDPR